MAFVKVATVPELDKNPLMEVMVNGNPYALCKAEGQVHALDGLCPHQGGPIGQGNLDGTGIMCPWHAWEFDCRTGLNTMDPDGEDKLATFPVRIEGEDILIDVA